jgi:uncharacterized protein YjbI with pentapeptide repeats
MNFISDFLRSTRIRAFSFLILLFLFYGLPTRAQNNEALHQRILAGEQISLNPSDSESARTIDAKWIKDAALKRVKIEIYRAVIQGPLDTEDVTFERGFTLASCTLKGDADFSHSIFKGDFVASDTTFRSWVSFRGASFEHGATLQRARFEAPIAFDDAHFLEIFDATEAYFAKNAGTVTFAHVRFDGNAVFGFTVFDADVNATFRSVAAFSGTTFKSVCQFSMAQFGRDGYFMGAQFLGRAAFDSAHFAGSLFFQAQKPLPAATFRENVEFTNTGVENIATFGGGDEFALGVVFEGKAVFDMVKFRGLSNFQGVEFKGDVQFIDATFENDAYFLGTIFDGDALFDRVQITGAALFSPQDGAVTSTFAQSTLFTRKVSFSGAHFGSEARFRKVRFDGKSDFVGTHFDSDAHFEGSEFLGISSFRSAICRAVYFSDGETAGQQQFMSDIDLLGCTYDRIQVDWRSLLRYPNGQSRIQPYDRQPYIELEAVLRKSGSDEDADAVYADRRRAENLKLKGLSKAKDNFYWLTANYGIDLWRECIVTLIFLGIGTFLFAQFGAILTKSDVETKLSWYQALAVAVRQFLPFALPVKSDWTPSRRILFKFVSPAVYANFLQVLGWVLIPLTVAWFVGFLRHGVQ